MFGFIYKRIKEDFTFLSDYGYYFKGRIESYVRPSVLFTNGTVDLQIGYGYDTDQIWVYRYVPVDTINPDDLLKGVGIRGKSYKHQVEQVKEALQKILDDWIR